MGSNYRIVTLQKPMSAKEYPYRKEAGYYDIVHKGTGIGIAHKDDMPRSMGEARALRKIMDSAAAKDAAKS